MARLMRLPDQPLFGKEARENQRKGETETKSVWSNRLLYLMDTPLSHTALANDVVFREMREHFPDEEITLADVAHLQQIKKAVAGDTKAYLAVSRVLEQNKAEIQNHGVADPFKKMADILQAALGGATSGEVIDAQFEEILITPDNTEGAQYDQSADDDNISR